MYLNSATFMEKLESIKKTVKEKSDDRIYFEEYIALPYYGQIILRFNLHHNHYTLEDLDVYEGMIREWVGDNFLIDFMGSVYKNVGLDLTKLQELFKDKYPYYKDVPLESSIHAPMIQEDAKYLLKACDFDENQDVWEIQMDEEIGLLILADQYEFLDRCQVDGNPIFVCKVSRLECDSLIKMALYAKRNHMSMVHVMMREETKSQITIIMALL